MTTHRRYYTLKSSLKIFITFPSNHISKNLIMTPMSKIATYKGLLGSYKGEQELQDFLEKNTEFIPREFVQNHGIHSRLVFRKLKLAENYTTDFFYLSKSSDDWNCVLIEIEKPNSKFFKDGTNDFHTDFLSGLDQIDRWRAWFNNSTNKDYFTNQSLSFIRQPLFKNPCYIKYVLVTGRRAEYEGSDLRRSLIQAKEREDFKIMTFDSLYESVEQHSKLYLCVKKNEYFEIHSDSLISDGAFEWIATEHIRVKPKLKEEIIKAVESFIEEAEKGSDIFQKHLTEHKKTQLDKFKQMITI